MVDEEITSATNDRVVAARRLHDRKGRRSAGVLLVEGPHALAQALAAAVPVHEVFFTAAFAARDPDLLAACHASGAAPRTVSEAVLSRIAETVTPQGVVAVVASPLRTIEDLLAGSPRLVVLLDAVNDPGNVGTVIRTSAAAGADGLLFGPGCADPTGGKAVRASAGSIFGLPFAAADEPLAALDAARAAGLQVLATTAAGDDDLDDLLDAGVLRAPTCWIFGNEARGVSAEALAAADRRVRIAIRGAAESLNLAAAAAVCLFASARAMRVPADAAGPPPLEPPEH